MKKQPIQVSEKHKHRKEEETEWLLEPQRLHVPKVLQCNKTSSVVFLCDPEDSAVHVNTGTLFQLSDCPVFQSPPTQFNSVSEEEFLSRYHVGEVLGEGCYGSVYAGVRKADGKMVAIKFVAMWDCNNYITIPGETERLPLEVALMKMASTPPRCDSVLELLEWFDTSCQYILVLERPSPCMDLKQFCSRIGRLCEPLAKVIMWQVVQAARQCCERGVLHGDIKPANLLINIETMQVKLIDFGVGNLFNDSPYTTIKGTPAFWPPEWIKYGQCMGCPATVWSLGVLLFCLVCEDLPFRNRKETANAAVSLPPYLSRECQELISQCLDKDPSSRVTFHDILQHEWFHI